MIRDIVDGDLAAIATIEDGTFSNPLSHDDLASLFARESFRGFVILGEDERLAGYVMFLVAGGLADMLSIGTAPGARRRGFASRLLRESLRRLANDPVDRVMLEVAVDNLAAKALYTGLGFREVGRREGYYRRRDGRVDAIVMSRQLHDEGSA